MVINFKAREISRGVRKLARTLVLIKKKSTLVGGNYIDVLHYLVKHNQYCLALTRGKTSKGKGKRRRRRRKGRSTSNKAVMKITTVLHLL